MHYRIDCKMQWLCYEICLLFILAVVTRICLSTVMWCSFTSLVGNNVCWNCMAAMFV